ncbi:Probable ferritin-1 [Aedoeadaptatus ivorii]|uniref:Ferritin n=1 Tax=Aedoeadaptatus ivorii TaxID=54006 RepID=A0A3S4ZRN9_9FIRM|nr:ferritin [Peptoniphilus ivorii]VEJ36305.1 Probable ferritin-1 [Peptoniphilus ivorii]
MSNELTQKLNEQFNFEIESAYIYMAMAAYVDDLGMKGFNHFFVEQAKEEMEHARAFYDFISEMDKTPVYEGIPKPEKEYGNFEDTFRAALDHEKEVTRRIKEIYKLAIEVGCLDTQQFLNKFIEEQREEEETFRDLVQELERIKENWGGLYILDGKLAHR